MKHMKEIIKQLANSVPEETKANVNSKYNFDNDNKALIAAFAESNAIVTMQIQYAFQ